MSEVFELWLYEMLGDGIIELNTEEKKRLHEDLMKLAMKKNNET